MAELNEEFYKKRLEKDLAELKKMIETHFVLRKKDEEELQELETRISARKEVKTMAQSSLRLKNSLGTLTVIVILKTLGTSNGIRRPR